MKTINLLDKEGENTLQVKTDYGTVYVHAGIETPHGDKVVLVEVSTNDGMFLEYPCLTSRKFHTWIAKIGRRL